MQTCPYSPEQKKFGTEAQAPLPPDSSPWVNTKEIKQVQQIVGSTLYYARVVDLTVLMALSLIAVKQTKATEKQWVDVFNYWITSQTTWTQMSNFTHQT